MLCSATGLNPFVHFVFLKLQKMSHPMSGHRTFVEPAVNAVTTDTEVFTYLVY
jgi:hypothetical protein